MWNMWNRKKVYMVLVAKHESKRPLGRPRRKREDNIKINLEGTGWEGEGAAQDRDSRRALVNTIINLRFEEMQRICRLRTYVFCMKDGASVRQFELMPQTLILIRRRSKRKTIHTHT